VAFRFLILTVISVCFLAQARAEQRFIVRVPGAISTLESACRLLKCRVLTNIGDPLGQLLVVAIDDTSLLDYVSRLSLLSRLFEIEPDLRISLWSRPAATSPAAGLSDRRLVALADTSVWSGYAYQPAAKVVRAEEARSRHYLFGAGPVAVIDTGVDPDHPALRRVLLPGYDFTRNRAGGSEIADIDQSTTSVVDYDQSDPEAPVVNGASPLSANNVVVAGLDQSTTAVVDNPRYRGFGHGTMVAGIIHLMAPRAQILPMKAFGSDGSGYTSDIIRAIYASVTNNARVINMSFSMAAPSKELGKALAHAVSRSVICVSSAGNDGRRATVYPASLDSVIGVASTDQFDRRASFSNYGDSLVWVAAPGEQIISTYPYSAYASASGTSFSTPFVAGAAALLVEARPSVDHWTAADAIGNAVAIGGELGHGRLDVLSAVNALVQ
jgi:subtilisin family serine protease